MDREPVIPARIGVDGVRAQALLQHERAEFIARATRARANWPREPRGT